MLEAKINQSVYFTKLFHGHFLYLPEMKKKHQVYLGTGTNLGDRRANLRLAIEQIENRVGEVLKVSKIYQTAAWGITEQPAFLNQVILIETDLEPTSVLAEVLSIEIEMGRIREQKWGTRVIDIDILYYGNKIVNLPHLKIPHPYIQSRNFVLIPLSEIAPDYVHPVFNLSNEQLYKQSEDSSDVDVLVI